MIWGADVSQGISIKSKRERKTERERSLVIMLSDLTADMVTSLIKAFSVLLKIPVKANMVPVFFCYSA